MIKNTSPPLNAEPPAIDGFTFVRPIGSGSTANVYLYRESGRDRPVAVKVGSVARDPQAATRIIHESDMLGRLPKHPHILPMLAMGTAGHGLNYLVLEYASGGSCKEILRTRRLRCGEMLDLGVKLADALSAAHRAGVLHRDVKPGNVLITATGEPALADFGIACGIYGASDACYSTPWAAPESLTHRRPCEGTDMYSLAALLYAMLAGDSPFEHGYRPRTDTELRNVILTEPVPPLGRTDVPEPVELMLRRAMEKNPADRFPSMPDFARELRRMRRPTQGAGATGTAATPSRTAMQPHERPLGRSGRTGRNRPSPRRRAFVAIIISATPLLLLVAFAGAHTDSVRPTEQVHVLDAEEPTDLVTGTDCAPPRIGARP